MSVRRLHPFALAAPAVALLACLLAAPSARAAARPGAPGGLAAAARDKIVTVRENGTPYFYDGSRLHWIPDPETYQCLRAQGRSVLTVATQEEVDLLGDRAGKPWLSPCFAPARVAQHIVEDITSGRAYFVSQDGLWRDIADISTYDCLSGKGYQVIESNTTQIDSLLPSHRGATMVDPCPAPPSPVGLSHLAVCTQSGNAATLVPGGADPVTGKPIDLCRSGLACSLPIAPTHDRLVCSLEVVRGAGHSLRVDLAATGMRYRGPTHTIPTVPWGWSNEVVSGAAPLMPGSWSCLVYVDGSEVASLPFTIVDRSYGE